MSPTIQKFVELERRKEEIRKYFDELQAAMEAVAKEVGVGTMFQDEQGIVYRIVSPDGRYVHFDKFACERTKREGETRGTLSAKEAKEAGFDVK